MSVPINGISNLQNLNVNQIEAGKTGAGQQTSKTTSSFGTVFQSYMDIYNKSNELQLAAEKMPTDFAARDKALASMNLTVQVTNAAINAYKEIMNMEI